MDPLVEHRFVRLRHGPRGAGEQCDQVGHLAQHRPAVTAGIGVPLVLHERTVLVETVFAGNVFEFGPEPVHGHLQLVRILPQDAAHGHDAALPDLVRPGRSAFVGHIRREMVHRTERSAELLGRQVVVHQHERVVQRHRNADHPVPPVIVPLDRRVVAAGDRPGQAGEDIGLHLRVPVIARPFGPVSGGQRIEFGEVAAHHHRNGGILVLFPQPPAVGGFVQALPKRPGGIVQRIDAPLHERIGQVGVRNQRQVVTFAHLVERERGLFRTGGEQSAEK